jgi:hypothetical protein
MGLSVSEVSKMIEMQSLHLPLQVERRSGGIVVSCPEILGLSFFAPSVAVALRSLRPAAVRLLKLNHHIDASVSIVGPGPDQDPERADPERALGSAQPALLVVANSGRASTAPF